MKRKTQYYEVLIIYNPVILIKVQKDKILMKSTV